MSDSMYYSLHSLLSRNAMFNFVVGERGNGKTFAFKDWAIRDYIKTGSEFIYLRRYDSELVDRTRFFEDIAQYYPEWEFSVKGYKAYMRKAGTEEWGLCGHFARLSNAVTKKSTPYPKVNKIGYDEFILDRGLVHYLPDELRAFQDFYNTVDRWHDRVRVIFMANSVSIMNPYFNGYKIRPKKDSEFSMFKKGYICVQYVKTPAFREHVKQTRFAKMIEDTPYYRYAVENQFRDDTDTFIRKKPSTAQFQYRIRFDGWMFGVWVDYKAGEYYVCNKWPSNPVLDFSLTKADHSPNLLMVDRTAGFLKSLRQLYAQGSVYFDRPETRERMNDVLAFLGVR